MPRKTKGGDSDIQGYGWYVQGGYLCHRFIELAVRYQELEPDIHVSNDRLQWTSVGLNIYIREHNLKIQTDYTFKNEQGDDVDKDVFQIQLQLDY